MLQSLLKEQSFLTLPVKPQNASGSLKKESAYPVCDAAVSRKMEAHLMPGILA
ncbi:MAG: hypothetical protein PVS3B3_22390 [Ktedonobacteraceae bacterium]